MTNLIGLPLNNAAFWRRMRDLSSSTWVIPRFLGKRVIKGNLAFQGKKSSDFFGINLAVMNS
jgi:hypothetical protein